jgi:hypothetical protein
VSLPLKSPLYPVLIGPFCHRLREDPPGLPHQLQGLFKYTLLEYLLEGLLDVLFERSSQSKNEISNPETSYSRSTNISATVY